MLVSEVQLAWKHEIFGDLKIDELRTLNNPRSHMKVKCYGYKPNKSGILGRMIKIA